MGEQLEHHQVSNQIPKHHVVVLAEGLHSPENVGSIFRICDALGVQKIYFSMDCPDVDNRRVKRTARNTIHTVPFEFVKDIPALFGDYKKQGYLCQALEITENSFSLSNYVFKSDQKYFVIIGSERHGVDDDRLGLVDESIHIPMFGKNSSMNVATALGIYLSKMAGDLN